jgi:hypothetical protein
MKPCPEYVDQLPSPEKQGRIYPRAYTVYRNAADALLPKLYYKISANWIPSLTSVGYRAIKNDLADLESEQHWRRLLHTAAIDLALFYRRFAFGIEGAHGESVNVKTQRLCNTISGGAFTAQDCNDVMIGRPEPKRTRSIAGTLSLNPLIGNPETAETLFTPGTQLVYRYTARDAGHQHEMSIPLYFTRLTAPLKLLFGIQPRWQWDTTLGRTFTITLFTGVRPRVTSY